MREILFRGKRVGSIDNGKWVYGDLLHDGFDYDTAIWEKETKMVVEVDPSTVGQYTGMTANGKRIFEGDVIKSYQGKILAVKFGQYRDDEEVVSGNGWYVSGEYGTLSFDERWGGHEIIGNIHDNPELMEGEHE